MALNLFTDQILQFSIDEVCKPYVLPNLGVWPVMHCCSHDVEEISVDMKGRLTNSPDCCEVNVHCYEVRS